MSSLEQKGFTLLEVLLAAGLMVIIFSSVYTTFSLADRAYTTYRQYGVRLQQLRTTMDLLQRELQSSYYNEKDPFSAFYLKTKDYYDRKLSEIEFSTIEGPRAPLRVKYWVREGDDGGLILYKDITTVDGKKMSFPVIEGIYYFMISLSKENEAVGIYNAEDTHRLPALLRISAGIIYNNKEVMEVSMTVNPRSEVFKW